MIYDRRSDATHTAIVAQAVRVAGVQRTRVPKAIYAYGAQRFSAFFRARAERDALVSKFSSPCWPHILPSLTDGALTDTQYDVTTRPCIKEFQGSLTSVISDSYET